MKIIYLSLIALIALVFCTFILISCKKKSNRENQKEKKIRNFNDLSDDLKEKVIASQKAYALATEIDSLLSENFVITDLRVAATANKYVVITGSVENEIEKQKIQDFLIQSDKVNELENNLIVMANYEQVMKSLQSLFDDYEKKIIPANEKSLAKFHKQTSKRNIPSNVVEQLTEFYKISNGIPCLDGLAFYRCDDEILYEWWDSDKALWLGSKDDDVFRWSNDKFCLGDASNVSFGEEYEFSTLVELLEKVFEESGW